MTIQGLINKIFKANQTPNNTVSWSGVNGLKSIQEDIVDTIRQRTFFTVPTTADLVNQGFNNAVLCYVQDHAFFRWEANGVPNGTTIFPANDGGVWVQETIGDTDGTVTSIGITAPAAFTVTNSPVTTSGVIDIAANGTSSQYIKGDGTLGTLPTPTGGTVTSVGLSMPSAFSVANSPVTSSGTIGVTATGNSTQYIDGTGALQSFPTLLSSDNVIRQVKNSSGATINAGTVVYIDNVLGNIPTIAKALATSDATSAQTYGMVQADIPNNGTGYIVVIGNVNNLNTFGLTEGAQLYLSSTVPGGYTMTKQYAPNHLVYVGIVLRAHPNFGVIGVKIQNGYELDELHNVSAQTPSNNNGIFYNTSTQLWEAKSISTVIGGSPVTGTGTSGQVTYWNGTSSVTGSNSFFWDSTNNRLGIGLTAPTSDLDITKSTIGGGAVIINIKNTNSGGESALAIRNDNYYAAFEIYGSTFPNATLQNQALISTQSGITGLGFATLGAANIGFRTNSNGTTNERLTIFGSTGNISINSTTDAGYKLDVNGTARFSGNTTIGGNVLTLNNTAAHYVTFTSSSTALDIQTFNSTPIRLNPGGGGGIQAVTGFTASSGIYVGSGTADGMVITGTSAATGKTIQSYGGHPLIINSLGNNVLIGTTTNAGYKLDVNGTGRFQGNLTVTKGASNYFTFDANTNTNDLFIQFFKSGVFETRLYTKNSYSVGALTIQNGLSVTDSLGALTGFSAGQIGVNLGVLAVTNTGGDAQTHIASPSGYSSYISFRENVVSDRGIIGYQNGTSYMQVRTNSATNMSNGTFSTAFFSSGNVGINTTTDSGAKLGIKGSGATSSTTSLLIQNSNSLTSLQVLDNSAVQVINEGNFSVNRYGNVLLSTGQAFTRLATYTNYIEITNTTLTVAAGSNYFQMKNGTQTEFYKGIIFEDTSFKNIDASALIEINSITKGFLTSRMTNAQRTAIATPAVGLMVYCTDAIEGLYIYKSTGWTFII